MAAEHGNAQAQYNLGVIYYEGCGTARSEEQAYLWCSLAAEQGDERAVDLCRTISERMSPDQLAKVQERVKEWNRKKTN
jgi:TPR repeat protein